MFLLDENTHGAIPDAIRRFNRVGPVQVDVIRVGEADGPPLGIQDDELLIWCEANGQILVSEDVTTLPGHLAAHLAAGPTLAYRAVKTALRSGWGRDLPGQLAHEAAGQGACGQSGDFREGVAAFLEKRAPAFRGD